MMNPTRWLLVLCALSSSALSAQAQTQSQAQTTTRGYGTLSIGGQVVDRTLTTLTSPTIYGDPASIQTNIPVGGGVLFDIGGGVRVWRKLLAGLSYSHYGDRGTGTITAQVPNPLTTVYRTTTGSADLKRSENAINLEFRWPYPVWQKLVVTGILGPSFIHVSQDLVNNISLDENAPPEYTTVTISSVSTGSKSGWGTGVDVGIDATYPIMKSLDGGLLLRYAGATATLTADSGEKIKAKGGGFQIGVGVRYRF